MASLFEVVYEFFQNIVAFFSYIMSFFSYFQNTPSSISISSTRSDNDNVSSNAKPAIILYYIDGCKYSVDFLSIWESFTEKAAITFPRLSVSKINCSSNKQVEIQSIARYIKGYPTIKLYIPSKEEIEFNCERTEEALINFINLNII